MTAAHDESRIVRHIMANRAAVSGGDLFFATGLGAVEKLHPFASKQVTRSRQRLGRGLKPELVNAERCGAKDALESEQVVAQPSSKRHFRLGDEKFMHGCVTCCLHEGIQSAF
jgi:hypothetical protein